MKKGLLIVLISGAFASAVAGILLLPQEEDRGRGLPPLRSTFVQASIRSEGAKFDCTTTSLPAPPKDLKFESRYDPEDRSRSTVDEERDAAYKEKIRSVRDYEIYVSKVANLAHAGNDGAQRCLIEILYDWASKKALLVDGANNQGKMVRGWALATIASAYMQIDWKAIPNDKKKPIRDWVRKLARKVRHDFPEGERRGLNNNHAYWATWAVAQAAIVLNNRENYDWALQRYRRHMEDIQADGTLPLELEREGRALMYHVFSAGPLLLMTQLFGNNGDVRDRDRDAIERLMSLIVRSVEDPAILQAKTVQKTEQDMSFLATGGAPIALYACLTGNLDAKKLVDEYKLTGSLSRLGGNLYQLVCSRWLGEPEVEKPGIPSPAPLSH